MTSTLSALAVSEKVGVANSNTNTKPSDLGRENKNLDILHDLILDLSQRKSTSK